MMINLSNQDQLGLGSEIKQYMVEKYDFLKKYSGSLNSKRGGKVARLLITDVQ